jgi:hypothetical protein
VLRAAANSLLSVLLIVTMFWGGCISCPQFFMLPGGVDDCCDEAGRCKKKSEEPPVEKQCQTMPLELQPSGVHHSPPIAVAEVDEIPVGYAAVHVGMNVGERENSAQRVHSPPDLQSLYSTYLI